MSDKFTLAYDLGFRDGLTAYAWYKDGVQQVGTTGRTLKQAKDIIAETWNYSPPIFIATDNAFLISLAPELAEALRKVKPIVGAAVAAASNEARPIRQKAYDQLCAVLAKLDQEAK